MAKRRGLSTLLFACWLAMLASLNTAIAQTTEARDIEIPAQPLDSALRQLAKTFNLQVLFTPEDVKGLATKGIKGRYSDQEAIEHLLEGTGLEAISNGKNAITITRPSQKVNAPRAMEAILVTAQKRSENPQRVPITLTAFGAEDLEKRNIENVRDLAAFTPGFNGAQFSNGRPIFAIRGAENTFLTAGAAKPVGVFVDEVYIPRFSASNFSLFDVESVSILKGPQGTLFGRNVTAGAILVQTREPSLHHVEANARAGVGNYGLYEVDGYLSAPLSRTVAGSVSIDRQKHDGYGRDILTGKQEDDADSWAGRAKLLVKPSATFNLQLSSDYSRDKNGGRALSALANSDSDRRTSQLGIAQPYDREIAGGSARMEIGDRPIKLTSVTGYRHSNSFEIFSRSGLSYQNLTSLFQEIGEERERDSAVSEELRLGYENQALNLIAGVFYFNEDAHRGFRKYRLAARTGSTSLNNFYDQAVKSTSAAPFADATWRVTEQVDLTGGVRYTYEKKDAQMTLTNQTVPANSFTGNDNHSWSDVTYRGVATYRPTSDITLYGSYATGFTAGGYNTEADQAIAFHTPFNPEKSANLELGLKSSFADGRGRFNIAGFTTTYKDKQEFVLNALTFIGNIINAAKATARGIEAEASFSPIRVLTLNGTFAYLRARYDKYDIPGAASATGNELANSPHVTYSLSADLNQPVSWGRLLAVVTFTHRDSYHPSGTLPDSIPATNILGAQIGIASVDERWRFVLWGRNLTNQQYPLIISNFVVNSEWLAPPRTFGLRISRSY